MVVSPGSRPTLANALSSRTGRATEAWGSPTYSWTTSFPAAVAGVGDPAGDLHDEATVLRAAGDVGAEVAIGEAGIGQAVPEGVADLAVEGVEAAVADEDAFAVADVAGLTGEVEVGRGVLQPQRERLGQPSRGVGRAKQQVGGRAAGGLAGQPAFQHRLGVLLPVREPHHRAVGQHHREVRVGVGEPGQQGRLAGRKVQVAAVESLRPGSASGRPG
jgi:hypothetical protein